MQFLAGDIGGTNSRFICLEQAENSQKIIAEKQYASSQFSDFYSVLNLFLSEHKIKLPIEAACFAVAGPVEFGSAAVTNLPWVISEEQLKLELHTPHVKLINDFVAAAYGISSLQPDDTLLIQKGAGLAKEPLNKDCAIIGAGTGFGAAHLVWLKDHYGVYSSESGHAGFAPENTQQSELLSWYQQQHQHVSLEMFLSGSGLHTIYTFLGEVHSLAESAKVHHELKTQDPARVITSHALQNTDERCRKTLEFFIDIYGAAASNVALSYYPVGELYIAGGIANKIQTMLLGKRFITAFLNKGVMTSNMQKITIKLITQEKVGLYGALSQAKILCDE